MQLLLGHANVNTSHAYLQFKDEDLRAYAAVARILELDYHASLLTVQRPRLARRI
jgi:hypothetical protein